MLGNVTMMSSNPVSSLILSISSKWPRIGTPEIRLPTLVRSSVRQPTILNPMVRFRATSATRAAVLSVEPMTMTFFFQTPAASRRDLAAYRITGSSPMLKSQARIMIAREKGT